MHKLAIVVMFPWLLIGIGGFTQTNDWTRATLVFAFAVLTLAIINSGLRFSLPSRVATSLAPRRRNKFQLYLKVFVICFYIVYVFKLFEFLASFDFNFLLMRDFYFSADSESYNVLFGIPILKTIYWYLIAPCAVALLICASKWRTEDYVLMALFVLANTFEGGRVGVYKLLILYVFASMKFTASPNKKRTIFFLGAGLGLVFIFVSISRLAIEGAPLTEFVSTIVGSLYDYHTIQLGILREARELPPAFGPLTGLESIASVIVGASTNEGALINYLGSIQFYTPTGAGPFNAFATSMVYFISPMGDLGIPVFFACIWLLFATILTIRRADIRINFLIFMMYSLYFSAFTPFAFGFMWWVMLGFISIFSFQDSYMKTSRVTQPLSF